MEKKLFYDIEPDAYRAMTSAEYECEWSPEVWTYQTNLDEAKHAVTAEIERIQKVCPDHKIFLALGDSSNFRYGVYSNYKSNRRKFRKPAGYSVLRQWLRDTFEVITLPLTEADDVVGILADQESGDVIYSRDKDLKTIPGLHLNAEGKIEKIHQFDADQFFYQTILTGDATDGFPGLKGYGPVTAKKLLAECTSELEMWEKVRAAYLKAAAKDPDVPDILSQARCARILRQNEYDFTAEKPVEWEPPTSIEGVFIPTLHD